MKIYCWTILFFITSGLTAQTAVFKYEKKFRQGTGSKSFHSYIAINYSTGELHLTIADNKSVERFIVDSNWQIKNHYTDVRGAYAQFPYDRFNTLQLINSSEGELNIYNEQGKKYEINRIDYTKNEEVNIANFELAKYEYAIASFTIAGEYCLVAANNKSDELKLITCNGTAQAAIEVRLNTPESELPMNKEWQEAAVIREDERDIEQLALKKKIYVYGNMVYITSDETEGTYVTGMNIKTGDITHHFFAQQYPGTFPKKTKSQVYNSFLWNTILVNGNVYNGDLSLSFYDAEKGTLLKNYAARFKDSIDFKNGFLLNKKQLPMEAEDFIDRIIKSGLLAFDLSAKDETQLELVVQNAEMKKTKNYGGGGFMMPGGSIQTPNGVVSLPSTFQPGGFWRSGEGSIKKDVSFTTVLHAANFEHVAAANNTKSVSALLEDELQELNENSAISIFRKNKQLYIGFYDSKLEAFVIKKIGQ